MDNQMVTILTLPLTQGLGDLIDIIQPMIGVFHYELGIHPKPDKGIVEIRTPKEKAEEAIDTLRCALDVEDFPKLHNALDG